MVPLKRRWCIMPGMEVRDKIFNLCKSIDPLDDLEKTTIEDAIHWIGSSTEIFRIEKPNVPDKHLVSYFGVFDPNFEKILLVEHKNAGLWLPSGGHVEPGEDPKVTVERECLEELGVEAQFVFDDPMFITATMTVGKTAGHTDVSLWYTLQLDSEQNLAFDKEEFHSVKWFDLESIPEKTDPQLHRYIKKVKNSVAR